MGTKVTLKELPKCNFCERQARYDFRTAHGPWAFGCHAHYITYRATEQLGTGCAQRLLKEGEIDDEH